jgi:hypothetical protein
LLALPNECGTGAGGGRVAIINSFDKDTVKPFATDIEIGLVYRDYKPRKFGFNIGKIRSQKLCQTEHRIRPGAIATDILEKRR